MSKKILTGWKVFEVIDNKLFPVTVSIGYASYHKSKWNRIHDKRNWGPYTYFLTLKAAESFKKIMSITRHSFGNSLVIKKVEIKQSDRDYVQTPDMDKLYLRDLMSLNSGIISDPTKVGLAEAFRIIN